MNKKKKSKYLEAMQADFLRKNVRLEFPDNAERIAA